MLDAGLHGQPGATSLLILLEELLDWKLEGEIHHSSCQPWAGFGANIDAIEVTSLPNMAFCFVQIPLLIMTSFFVGKLKVQFNQKSVPPS